MSALRRAHHPLAVVAWALAAAALVPQTSAGAQKIAKQEIEQQEFCANKAGLYAAEFSVEACTFLILSGDKTPKAMAIIYSDRCKSYLAEHKFDRALQDCDEAIWLDANYLAAYQIRGLVHEQVSRHRRAVADFAQVIAQQPSSASAWQGICRNELALSHLRLAISACSESLQWRPADSATLVTRGLSYLLSGAFDEAMADFDVALRANPALPTALYGRGIARLNRHDSGNGKADIAAAKSMQGDIAQQFADLHRHKTNGGLLAATGPGFDEINW